MKNSVMENQNKKRGLENETNDSKSIQSVKKSKKEKQNNISKLKWTVNNNKESLSEDQKWRLTDAKIILNDEEKGFMVYFPNALSTKEVELLTKNLDEYEGWHREFFKIFGKNIQTPRVVCSFGEEGQTYTYAGRTEKVENGWNGLDWLLKIICDISNQKFNYCHANLYKDGSQYIGWHSDKEGDMVENSIIASVSIGQERDFQIRNNKKGSKIETIRLKSGSFVLMGGVMQKNYKHCVPKRKKQNGKRYNLTFRKMK